MADKTPFNAQTLGHPPIMGTCNWAGGQAHKHAIASGRTIGKHKIYPTAQSSILTAKLEELLGRAPRIHDHAVRQFVREDGGQWEKSDEL